MFYQTKTRLAIVSSLCVWLIERAASIRFTLFSEKPSLSPTLSRKQMLVRCIVLKHEIKIYFPLCVEVCQKQQNPEHHTPLKHSISFVFIFFLFFKICFAKTKMFVLPKEKIISCSSVTRCGIIEELIM